MTAFEDLNRGPHRRWNPLTRDWVLVSPHRTQRPWQGQVEKTSAGAAIQYDPSCYLCPGNERAGGARNPGYTSTFVFTNDFAALRPDVPPAKLDQDGLLVAESESGTCRVVCFSPRHDLTLARMAVSELETVVRVWTAQYGELGSLPGINYVQVFENRGEIMGCSNPHPHGQIWANHTVPNEPRKEQESQQAFYAERGSCLLCEYLKMERAEGARLVCENDHFAALVPFWAVWPFEILLISKQHARDFTSFSESAQAGLADILKRVTTRYDNLFEISFPYSMGFHAAPTDSHPHPEWHFHGHFYPPLLRSATIRKFMVGYEMLAGPQRDITPEVAAGRLREVGEVHYAERT